MATAPLLILGLSLLVPAEPSQTATSTYDAVLSSPLEHDGDIEALRHEWWTLIEDDPNSRIAQLALLMWDQKLRFDPTEPISATDWQRVLDRTTQNGWAQRMVAWRWIQALHRSDPSTARSVDMTAGAPRRWIGIGPFGRRTAAALHRSYPPELRFDPEEICVGSDDRNVRWRDISTVRQDTRIYPSSEWGRRGAIYYLRSRFESRAVEGLFQFASTGSFRVWLDGREIATVDRSRELSPTATRIGVSLDAGAHTLLVKCSSSEFAALLRRPDGFPIAIVDIDPRDPSDNADSKPIELDSRGLLLDEFRRSRPHLTGLDLLAFAYAAAAERDSIAVHQALLDAEATEVDPVAFAIAATELIASVEYLTAEWRKSWLEDAWTRAEQITQNCIPIRLYRAQELGRDDKGREASEAIDAILERQPRSLAALLQRESLCDRYGWRKERRDALDALLELAPGHRRVLTRWLAFRTGEGRTDLRLPILQKSMAKAPTLARASALADALALSDRREDAVEWIERFAELGGNSTRALESEYEQWKQLGETERAIRTLEALRRRRPDSAALHRDAGNYYWEDGRVDDAARAYRASLAILPGQWQLLERLAHFEQPELLPSPDRFFTEFRRDSDEALAAAPPTSRYPRAAATYLIDQMVTRIDREGGGAELVHQLVRLDSDQAVEQFSTLNVPGEVLEIRVITPTGEVLHPTSGGEGGGFTLPGLAPGSVVEYRSVSRFDIARARDLSVGPFYFRDPNFQSAFHLTEWIVILPEEWDVVIDERNLTEERSERRVDGYRELRWTYREMEPALPEFRSPPGVEILPNAAVRSQRDWDGVLEAVAAAGARPDHVTPVTRAAVAEILQDSTADPRQRALRLYEAVCDRIKNTNGPNEPTGIWLERSGDRDLLLAALLRAAEIDYEWVFGSTREDMDPFRDWSIPSIDAFSFSMIRIPIEPDPLYLTTLFRLGEPGRIPPQVQGGRALVARDDSAEWIQLPTQSLEREARTLTSTLILGDGSAVKAKTRAEFRLLAGSQLKEQLSNVSDFQRTAALEGFVRNTYRRARVLSGTFPELESRSAPFAMEFEAESPSPGILSTSEGRPVLQTIYTPSQLRAGFVRTADRKFPYFSNVENLLLEENRVELGSNFKVRRLPKDSDLAGPWGTFQLTFETDESSILIKRRLWLKPFVIEASKLNEFYDFCAEVDSRESQPIVLERLPSK